MNIPAQSREDLERIPGDTPRYGAGANIENHPQVTDYVPRRYRVIALVLVIGLGLGLCGEVVSQYADVLGRIVGTESPGNLAVTLAEGIVGWTSAAVLLLTACYARLIYSLRRHRLDDNRGRYRIWRLAAWSAVLLSLNSVVNAHLLIGQSLAHLTGLSILPGGLGWWLVPAALVGGWLLLRVTFDAAECRTALTAYFLAIMCLTAAGIAHVWTPSWIGPWHGTLARLLPLGANLLLSTGTLLFARYVVLDVQGLIDHGPMPEPLATAAVSARSHGYDTSPASDDSDGAEIAQSKPDQTRWTDGSDSSGEFDEQDGARRLSKAERKRLRKLKTRNRAA